MPGCTHSHFILNKSVNFSLEKSTDSDIVKIKGVASTGNKDRDGEIVKVSGINHDNLKVINWNHLGNVDPECIIGKVTKAYKNSDSLIVHGDLHKSRKYVRTIEKDITALSSGKSAIDYGMSIEGRVVERDPYDRQVITKCAIDQVAVTVMPANTDTVVSLDIADDEDVGEKIAKSFKTLSRNLFSESKGSGDRIWDWMKNLGITDVKQLKDKKWTVAEVTYILCYRLGIGFYDASAVARLFMEDQN